ncbi:hypothetical protein SCLCIDRAFT_1220155 [Scleroderma citrinum Foug A]|uniref:Uncharacterized protein n=1 Tax=Scleroderma citrinum Foug A TaxID=1036808 RepID=A0A0C3D7J1_9AGAM|nr:hypothetical protein SCLCIDRAFT_1220155 [Scleroderma citrinum Foug A]
MRSTISLRSLDLGSAGWPGCPVSGPSPPGELSYASLTRHAQSRPGPVITFDAWETVSKFGHITASSVRSPDAL